MRMRVRLVLAPLLLAALLSAGASAQREAGFSSVDETRQAISRALKDRQSAEARARVLEGEAARAGEAAEKIAQQTAALAARIQESEASIAAAEARLSLIDGQRRALAARLAQRQKPVVRLTAALQRFSRRPLALSVMRPGSVKEMVYLRAMLGSTVPEVQRRTAALRGELARGKALQRQAERALADLRGNESLLEARRKELAALETRQRLDARRASGDAAREAERALALAEEARDLNGLVAQLDAAGNLRERLAALPGPIIRPPRPEESRVIAVQTQAAAAARPPAGYQLPVAGRTVTGFGAPTSGGALTQGITLAPRGGAQVVAPAAGRVVFAGPYRGYGRIAIIEHEGGWTTLVTGMARVDVVVGQQLVRGAPLGIAAPTRPLITLELRRDGAPVNPLEFLG
ncbi:murein hydrolase activator EnvC family protein [Altererythrobacter fulvus]|uniref:murein hydrolase activator EnvC family protein n=1 Tax=Caenibius fulvus TaxID=2126012 RepID=UPI0030166EDC